MSQQRSRLIESAQIGPHEDLSRLVARHLTQPFRKPFTDYNRAAFQQSLAGWDQRSPLILDTGCGVGLSTLHLAREFPDHYVIGIDQSEDRLTRNKSQNWPYPWPDNLVWVRADLVDYWRLWSEARLPLARHYLLYPNPWPKIGHLARRWHGHAVFPTLLSLGGILECRSNWSLYVEEFAAATRQVTGRTMQIQTLEASDPITPFERKYRDSGHTLWQGVVDLTG